MQSLLLLVVHLLKSQTGECVALLPCYAVLTITQECRGYQFVFGIDISALSQQQLHNLCMSVVCCKVQCCVFLHELYNQMQKYMSLSLVWHHNCKAGLHAFY